MAEWLREQNVGSKLVNLPQLNSQAVFDSTCKGKSIHNLNIGVCVITFLPHILDSGEDEREKYLETIRNVVRKFRGKPFTFVWSQGGDQYDFETIFGAEGSGYQPWQEAFRKNEKGFRRRSSGDFRQRYP
jgi:hypothetical protein